MLQSNRSIRLANKYFKTQANKSSLRRQWKRKKKWQEWNNLNPRQLHGTYTNSLQYSTLLELLFYISGKQINYSCPNYQKSSKVYPFLSSINGIVITNNEVCGRALLQEKIMRYKFQVPTAQTSLLTAPLTQQTPQATKKRITGLKKNVKYNRADL